MGYHMSGKVAEASQYCCYVALKNLNLTDNRPLQFGHSNNDVILAKDMYLTYVFYQRYSITPQG